MLIKHIKNLSIFFGLLLLSVLCLLASVIPQFISVGAKFLWFEGISDSETYYALIVLLLAVSVFIIVFGVCVKQINKAVKILKDSDYEEFHELDLCGKGCDTVIYGYYVPIATINRSYSADGKIGKLVEKQGVVPLLCRRRQLTYRSELVNDIISCTAALLLSLVTAYITGAEIQRLSSFNVIFTIVIIGICISSVFLRPVVTDRFQSKYEADIRDYELHMIEEMLLYRNQKLELMDVDYCGKKERRSKIRKLQKELDLSKGRLKKKKIREEIKLLENGGDISHRKISVLENSNGNMQK